MIRFEEAEERALLTGQPLMVDDQIFGIDVRFICTADMGWVIPVVDISKALGIPKTTGSDLISRNKELFEPYLTIVRLTRSINNPTIDNIKCLTREGLIMFLMKLTPSRMDDKDVASRIMEFQQWAVSIIAEHLDYCKVPQWWARREAAKIKYRAMTDAIKDHIITDEIPEDKQWLVYATEADMLNVVIFGKTASKAGCNQRNNASQSQLELLAKFEDMNEGFIRLGFSIGERYDMICRIRDQMIKHGRIPQNQLPEHIPEKPVKYIVY